MLTSKMVQRLLLSGAAVGALVLTVSAARTAHAATPPVTVARFHLALSKAEPAKNDTVATSPAAIKLWFTETVQASATSARLTGPAAHAVVLGAVTVDKAEKSPAVFPVKETLKPGKYTVAWKTMATDGHPSNGTFSFVVKAAK